MATASSSPTDTEVAALIRAHVLATIVSGAFAALLFALVYLQLLNPGILGDVPWLGLGRLRFALTLVILFGWFGNALAFSCYAGFPELARLVLRVRAGAWKFGVWNVVITAPIVVMALAGILPPPRLLTVWFVLSGSHLPMIGTGLLMVASLLMSVRMRIPVAQRPFDIAFLMIILGAIGVSVVDGIGGAIAQAAALDGGKPWLDGVAAMRGYWLAGGVSALVIFWGCVLLCVALVKPPAAASIPWGRLSRVAFGFAVLAILTWPVALYFAETLDASSTPATASEMRGRSVFIREGCASCHGGEGRGRIGPDLSRESGARPADWHYAHLFAPRTVTPLSVMPSYAHLFTGAADSPTQEGRDLVAYLDSLGRAKDLGAPDVAASEVHPAMHPARARRVGATPSISGTGNQKEGLHLFATYCAGCHGPKGEGDGPAAAGLRPKPANLAAHRYTDEQVITSLWNGVAGTAMPAWRDQPLDRLAHLITAVQSLQGGLQNQAALRMDENGGRPADGDGELGARVYAAHCSQCHGDRGGGDGFSAASLAVAPANFQRQQPSLDYALRAIAGGVEGTPMAPWTTRISERELLAVAQYVRSFYTGTSSHPTAPGGAR